jgi:hypothetical protein
MVRSRKGRGGEEEEEEEEEEERKGKMRGRNVMRFEG